MTKKLSLLFSSLTLIGVSGIACADDSPYVGSKIDKEETAGFISGAAIGAAAGGPPGAIVGAAIGAFIGDGWVTRNEYKDMQSEWVTMQLEVERAAKEAEALEQEKLIALQELEALRNSRPRYFRPIWIRVPKTPCSITPVSLSTSAVVPAPSKIIIRTS